jgi:hypothetical protein
MPTVTMQEPRSAGRAPVLTHLARPRARERDPVRVVYQSGNPFSSGWPCWSTLRPDLTANNEGVSA